MKNRNRLLIVDDLEMNRAILGNIFKKNYEIAEASDGDEALEYIQEHSSKIIAILLDLIMPKVKGIEVLKTMKKKNIGQEIPVFIITADNSEETMYEAYKLGVKDILEKPFVPYFLKKRIENVIELYRVKDEQNSVIETLNQEIVEVLAQAIEFRDNKLGEHVKNIKTLTAKLLKRLKDEGYEPCKNLSDEDIRNISSASVLHDIGKIGITDEILNKKIREQLPEDKKLIEVHPVRGAEILSRLVDKNVIFKYAYDICYNHHERWDGNGYPNGLVGDEINIWAQIVGMLDIYDKLLNGEEETEVSKSKAIDILKSGKYGVFNPKLLEVLKELELNKKI